MATPSTKVLLPPIAQEMEPVNPENRDLYGSIVLSEEGKLMKKYLTYQGFTSFLTLTYDNWITNIIPKQILAYTVKIPGRGEIFFDMNTGDGCPVTGTFILSPQTNGDEKKPMYPYEARISGRTYYITLQANAKFRDVNGTETIIEANKCIGQIPLMLGSNMDNLKRLNAAKLVEVYECPNDPYGYFIINGLEKIILIQEMLRMNRVFVYFSGQAGDRRLSAEMVVPTYRGSKKINISVGKRAIDGYEMNFDFLGKNKEGKSEPIPLFLVFQLLGFQNVQDIYNSIFQFTDKKQTLLIYHLKETEFRWSNISNPYEYLKTRRTEWGKMSPQAFQEYVFNALIEDLFPQINYITVSEIYQTTNPDEITSLVLQKKIEMLSLMTARLVEVQAGFRPVDERDSWSNKRLESGPRSMETLFGSIWKKMMEGLQEKINTGISYDEKSIVRDLLPNVMLEEFNSAFNANNWGVKGPKRKENLTEFLDRNSIISVYGHLTKVKSPVSTKAKSTAIRLIQPSQLGYICSAYTPEGEMCGITKNLAITAQITVERESLSVYEALRTLESDPVYSIINEYEPRGKRALIIVNGFPYKYGNGQVIRDALVNEYRRRRRIHEQTTIIYIPNDNILYIYTDSSRPVRPLLVVENGQRVIDTKGLYEADIDTLLAEGAIEYLDAWEQEYIHLAQNVDDLQQYRSTVAQLQRIQEILTRANTALEEDEIIGILQNEYRNYYEQLKYEDVDDLRRQVEKELTNVSNRLQKYLEKPYTHAEIDPNAQFGVAASVVPLPNHQPGPRTTYQSGMGKQALGIYHSNYMNRFDTTGKVLAAPTRPMFETQINELLGLDKMPNGDTVIVAIMPYLGFNQEDGIIMSKRAIDNGLFMMSKLTTYEGSIKNGTNEYSETFAKPPQRASDKPDKYKNLDDEGIVKVGSYVEDGDIVIGRVRSYADRPDDDISIRIGLRESGVVRRVYRGVSSKGISFVRVLIQQVRVPQIGDKFASRYSQKGTVTLIVPPEDMPFVAAGPMKGVIPDIIINPHAIPSRMTMGKMIEIVTSKVAAMTGERVNATGFQKFDIQQFQEQLVQYNFSRSGNERMINGMTGEQLTASIFIGPCYYQALRHHVKDKIQMRGRGGVNPLTGQPFGGRSKEGGQKYGKKFAGVYCKKYASPSMSGNTFKFRGTHQSLYYQV